MKKLLDFWGNRYHTVGKNIKIMTLVMEIVMTVFMAVVAVSLCVTVGKNAPWLIFVFMLGMLVFIFLTEYIALALYGFGIIVERAERTPMPEKTELQISQEESAPKKKLTAEQKDMIATLNKWQEAGLITPEECEEKIRKIKEI